MSTLNVPAVLFLPGGHAIATVEATEEELEEAIAQMHQTASAARELAERLEADIAALRALLDARRKGATVQRR